MILAASAAWFFAGACFGAAEIFVSTNGSDSASGAKGAAFATLKRAAQKAVEMFKAGQKEVKIVFQPGMYFFSDSVEFVQTDIPKGAKLSICAAEGGEVLFHGGVRLPVSKLGVVSDKSVLSRLPPEKPDGKLYFLELDKNGLKNCGDVVPRAYRSNVVSQMEAFLDSKPMRLARYPNSEYEFHEFGEVVSKKGSSVFFKYDYDRPERWVNVKKAWIYGRINRGWYDACIPLKSVDVKNKTLESGGARIVPGKSYFKKFPEKAPGYNPALDIRGYSVVNLLEEADKHGEYYVDTDAGKFYAVIDDPSKYKYIDFSLMETPFIVLEGVSNVTVSGIKFTCSRGNGVAMSKVSDIRFENCEFFNLGLAGIAMEKAFDKDRGKSLRRCLHDMTRPYDTGSKRVEVVGCKFYDLGAGGVLLMGGNIPRLERGDNLVADCVFERVCRLNKSYAAAVRVYGCGNTVEHCRISDLPHEAIAHNGVECTIRRNYIENVCNFSDDMGAIYGGANPYERGVLIAENFFNNIKPKVGTTEISAVFIDDGNGGVAVRDNIICRTGTTKRPALFIHGGKGNYFEHNVFLDCPTMIRCDFWSDKQFRDKMVEYRKKHLDLMGGDDSLLLKKYPDLSKVFSDGVLLNYVTSNKVFRTGGVFKGVFYLTNNRELVPSEDVPADVEWTLDNIKKYFGSDSLVKRLASLHYGPRKK